MKTCTCKGFAVLGRQDGGLLRVVGGARGRRERIHFGLGLSLAITLHPSFVSSGVETLRDEARAGLRNCFTALSRGL